MNAFVNDQNLYSKIIKFLFVWIMFSITPVVVSCVPFVQVYVLTCTVQMTKRRL